MARYPLTMKHPNEKRSQPQAERGVDQGSGKAFVDYRGTPDMFPPVVVNNERQEGEHRAKGYVGHDEAFPETGEYVEYPKWMQHETHDPVMVNTAEQQAEAEAKGYFEPGHSDSEAVEAAHAAPYVPGRQTAEWPKMVNGVMSYGPEEPDTGPVQYPKALTPPHGGEQVFVNNPTEEAATFKRWGLVPKKNEIVEAPDGIETVADIAEAAKKAAKSEKMKASWAKRKAKTEGAPAE